MHVSDHYMLTAAAGRRRFGRFRKVVHCLSLGDM